MLPAVTSQNIYHGCGQAECSSILFLIRIANVFFTYSSPSGIRDTSTHGHPDFLL
jgi:hypothetical protein